MPEWLFRLPRLPWVAFSGNPVTYQSDKKDDLDYFEWNEFKVDNLLGEGASGYIYKADWRNRNKQVAIKVFKGEVTSDGLPEDEMKLSIQAGNHSSLIKVLGKINNHTGGKSGLMLELIPSEFINLGNQPSFATCTRDVLDDSRLFSENELLKIAKSIASVGEQLHQNGINHGDLYAYNTMINESVDTLLGDFGAGTFYNKVSNLAPLIERVEVRAFGCLVEDVFLKQLV